MAFRFSLASVLRLRESLEKREEIALQMIQMEIALLRRNIDELTAEIAQRYEGLQAQMLHPVEARRMHLMLNEIDQAIDVRQDLILKLEVSLQKQHEQLKAYRNAVRDRRTLSEMRSQKLAEYEQSQQRLQQKFIDDIFAARFQSR